MAAAVYFVISWLHGSVWRASPYAYFNYQADAFVHGQLHLRQLPQEIKDLSFYRGQYYLYWPPLPAVLLMPFAAVFGVGFNDIVFTIGVGAANIGLVALLLRACAARGVVRLAREQRGLLVLFVAFGTVHVTLAPYGRVWFTAQLIGFACVLLAYLAALIPRGISGFVLAGSAIAAAFLTRNHLLFAGLWPACYLLYRHRTASRKCLLGYILAGLAPMVVAISLLALYNWQRFGSPYENGIPYHQMSDLFEADYLRYGAFSLHYVPTNLYYQFVAYPFPVRESSLLGGSLFLLSPVFFAAFWGIVTGRPRWSTWVLVATTLLVAVPILLLMGTGWVQWGPRYTLDYTVPLLLLTAIGIRRWPQWLLTLLTAISVAHYVLGMPIGYAG